MFARIAMIVAVTLLALPIAPVASPVEAKKRSKTVTRTFANTALIDLPSTNVYLSPATLYPSPIQIKGLKGKIRDVNLRLNDLSHNNPRHLAVLLVGPRGQTARVMFEIGGTTDVNAVTLILDDEAEAPLPYEAQLQSGTYQPANPRNSTVDFLEPAPSANANVSLSVFDGTNPNGVWHLFVMDVYPEDAGAISGGWELEITAKVKAKKKKR